MSEAGTSSATQQARSPSAAWKTAVAKVQQATAAGWEDDAAGTFAGDNRKNVPSIIAHSAAPPASAPAPVPPRLAVLIHAAHGLPSTAGNSRSSTLSLKPRLYAKVSVHGPGHLAAAHNRQKTLCTCQRHGSVVWNSLLSLSPEHPQDMVLTVKLKRKHPLLNSKVVWGVASLPLSEVLSSPAAWGERQHLELKGHKLQGAQATVELQLFLSTERITGPLSVLAATWNVGNAQPPPPEQLQDWLRGTNESVHHLVAVGAQECNYKEGRRSIVQRLSTPRAKFGAAAAAAVVSTSATNHTATENGLPDTQRSAQAQNGSSSAAVTHADTAPATLSRDSGGETDSDDEDDLSDRINTAQHLQVPCNEQDNGVTVLTGQQPTAATAAPLEQQVGRIVSSNSSSGGEQMYSVSGLRYLKASDSRTARLKKFLLEQVDSANAWERHISAALGHKYWLVASKHMFQTRILLFARMDVVPYISNITAGFEATGIGHVGLNKGGVAVSLKLDDTHLAFVSSHLAAHQSKIAQRNSDMSEICANLKLQQPGAPGAPAGADLCTGFHHLVWMGDLNYRLDYGLQATTQADSPAPQDFTSMCSIIAAGDYDKMLLLDQLRRQQAAGCAFAGFSEGQINFAPTFKMLKDEPGFAYAAKRSPAWCDRVLTKSALPHKAATCQSYFTVPSICTSDHKPVGAVLSLPLVTNTVTSGQLPGGGALKLFVASVQLQGQSTWQRLADIAANQVIADSNVGENGRSGSNQSVKFRAWKLKLVLSGACLAGPRHRHAMKVNQDTVTAGCAAVGSAVQPVSARPPGSNATASLTVREESVALLPGAAEDLQDDWLLLRLVLVEGLQSRTLARGIVPLLPAVQEYTARTFKAVQVPVQLECNGAAAGTATLNMQLISSQSARQGMYEAIRRMRLLANYRSFDATANTTAVGKQKGTDRATARSWGDRTVSGSLVQFGSKVLNTFRNRE